MCPELPLPPEAIPTRWGSWLNVVEFYAKNIEKVKAVVFELDASEAVAIEKAQTILSNPKRFQ
jgi:hypothetical protein